MTSPQHETWTGYRVAHPVGDLARSASFYRDRLRLPVRDRFSGHDGYDGVIFTLPGGGELELTAGPAAPSAGTDEDLLVLYTGDAAAVADGLDAAGVPSIMSANPYWTRFGRTFLDPDGYRVVVATSDHRRVEPPAPKVDWHTGPRAELRDLFELADDSATQLAHYMPLGRVLVAHVDGLIAGHLQLLPTTEQSEIEIKNMAVRTQYQRSGVGRALVDAAVETCQAEGLSRLVVATAAADIGNLRFYQRVGFRFATVERDAFIPATGYPDPIVIDRIPLRDRVWLSRQLDT
jgi:ribosomal protein S18 acetylase RimI-like enzyme